MCTRDDCLCLSYYYIALHSHILFLDKFKCMQKLVHFSNLLGIAEQLQKKYAPFTDRLVSHSFCRSYSCSWRLSGTFLTKGGRTIKLANIWKLVFKVLFMWCVKNVTVLYVALELPDVPCGTEDKRYVLFLTCLKNKSSFNFQTVYCCKYFCGCTTECVTAL